MSKNFRKTSGGKGKQIITQQLAAVFHEHPTKNFNPKQLASMLDVRNPHDRTLINVILSDLANREIITEIERGKYRLNGAAQTYITGRAEVIASGAAYVVSEESENDVYISPQHTKHAMTGDTVKVSDRKSVV